MLSFLFYFFLIFVVPLLLIAFSGHIVVNALSYVIDLLKRLATPKT